MVKVKRYQKQFSKKIFQVVEKKFDAYFAPSDEYGQTNGWTVVKDYASDAGVKVRMVVSNDVDDFTAIVKGPANKVKSFFKLLRDDVDADIEMR